MDFDEVNNEKRPKTWGEYLSQYVFESLLMGFFFGIGHFLAYKFLLWKPFNDLKMLARK